MREIQSPNEGQRTTTCEVSRCRRPAEYLVSATWSIADFLEYELCQGHAGFMVEQLVERKVNGKLPIAVRLSGPYHLEDSGKEEGAWD
jgi:hypothetical protein